MSWFDAAAYCNWLSEREHLPICYKIILSGHYSSRLMVDAKAVEAGGYRLPTEAEWEYACRAGTVTSRYFGHAMNLLGSYERYIMNSGFRAHPCGTLLPNDLGLFDMLGNVMEWCHSRNLVHPKRMSEQTVITDHILTELVSNADRDLRGGSWRMDPAVIRSSMRSWFAPANSQSNVGFCAARTGP